MKKFLFIWLLSLCSWIHALSQPTPQNSSKSGEKGSLNVLFATNEDCDLYINNELKGNVSRTDFRYIQLPPGRYQYKARSRATSDELTDSFFVAEGRLNEIFMDLLYVVDEKTAEREKLRKAIAPPVVLNGERPSNYSSDSKKSTNKDAETGVITSILGNMVLISGGNFIMGNNKAPFPDEAEHAVAVRPVLFSKYEVTQHQWEGLMGYNPSVYKGCATCPVENVSWEEANKFIKKLNAITSRKFRLPTEAEWEYVARLGGKIEIDTAGGPEAYIKKTAWYFANSNKTTHPVGTRQPNVAGIYDITGNVSEWCSDWYGASYYRDEFNQVSPQGPASGKEKIVRGGNFKEYSGDRFRPSLRNKRNPFDKSGEVGFRLVMELN